MTGLQVCFPVDVRACIAPFLDRLTSRRQDTPPNWTLGSVLTSICSGVQVSRSTDLTFEMCVPMLR
jgi:hypothetical protein